MQTRPGTDETIALLNRRLQEQHADIVGLMRDLVAIPSVGGDLRMIQERLLPEMEKLGFDEARLDGSGTIVGRIGKGSRVLLFDTHLDTAGIGDANQWHHDPFKGRLDGDMFYGRGAGDGKGTAAAMLYAMPLIRELGLSDLFTVYFVGTASEQCEGRASQLLFENGVRPDFVVLGLPTGLRVARGQRGRQEIRVTARGKAVHGGSPWNGHNPVHDLLPYIASLQRYATSLPKDDFLGSATCNIGSIACTTPSAHSVPDTATIHIDRRLLPSESEQSVVDDLKALDGADHVEIHPVVHDEPTWNGYSMAVEKTFPGWITAPDQVLVQAAQKTREALGHGHAESMRSDLSSDGAYWAGVKHIPCIGLGPGDEAHAHTVLDQVSLNELVAATGIYALLPLLLDPA